MADKSALDTYGTLCRTLDSIGCKYKKDDDRLSIEAGYIGDDIPMPVRILVEPEHGIVSLLSVLPVKIPPERYDAVAYAVARVNWRLADGDFDFDSKDPEDGTIVFRLTVTYAGAVLSERLFEYMINVSMATVDRFNDRFAALVEGKIDTAAFED